MTPSRFRSAAEAEAHLLGLINYENLTRYRATTRSHDLDRFTDRLSTAGWIPGSIPTVHVGGTNGKGTVSTLLERVLRAGGIRTGLYTSPHLRDMRERIRVDGVPLSRARFRDRTGSLASVFAEDPGAGFRTTFEFLTAIALLEFQEAGVGRAVLEVGLGGRRDATNVIPGGPAVLTPISLDHEHILGRTVGAIARDKAHILKPGGAGFIMPQTPPAWRAIRDHAERRGVPLVAVEEAVRVEVADVTRTGTQFLIRGERDHGLVRTRLLGSHQAGNVAAVVAVAEALLPGRRAGGAVAAGLAGARVPGRGQPLRRAGREFLIDGGHNAQAGAALAATLATHFPGDRVTAVIGMASDKNHHAYLEALHPVVDRFLFTRSRNPRAADPRVLREANAGGAITTGVSRAILRALESPCDLIVVCGSFLVAGEALDVLAGL